MGNSNSRIVNNFKEIRTARIQIQPSPKDLIKKEEEDDDDDDYNYEEIVKKIQIITGFKPYNTFPVKLNKEKKKIKGIYYQNDRGCILYALINEGWIDEKLIPDSMKYYKNHTYTQDNKDFKLSILIKILSRLDLAHLWTNLGGLSPYIEIDVEEAKRRIYRIIGRYLENGKSDEIIKALRMSKQNVNYYTIIGNLNVKIIRFRDIEKIKDNPSIKNAINTGVIQKDDILGVGDHFFCYNGKVKENDAEAYSFIDSISNYYKINKDELRSSNCVIYENDGIVNAFDQCLLLNIIDSDSKQILKLIMLDN